MTIIKTPESIRQELSQKARQRRLAMNLSQQGLADRSGVNIATLRVFERKGKVSLDNLLKLAAALGALDAFENLFSKTSDKYSSLDDILTEEKQRQRGRIK